MKNILLILSIIFFIGCSDNVSIPVIKNPNSIQNQNIRALKIDIKNDSINLKQNILNQMYYINNEIPNYFKFNEYTHILNGDVIVNIDKSTYTKNVSLNPKPPICVYKFYKCKSINSEVFCNMHKPALKLTIKQYNNIKKNIFTNDKYILYNKKIYKLKKSCKPTHTKIKCEKQSIEVSAIIDITNSQNKTIFSRDYVLQKIDDPCKNIKYYENKKIYTTPNPQKEINDLSLQLAKNIIADIAPHTEYIQAKVYDSLDIELNDKDEDLFKQTQTNDIPYTQKINILKKLNTKYPKSCVIKYNLAINLIYKKQYNTAKQYLNDIINSKCDKDIKRSSQILLLNLYNTY